MRKNLLTLLPPYFSFMSPSQVKDGCSRTRPFIVCEPSDCFYGCVLVTVQSVQHTAGLMFVKCNKPHKVERNWKMLYVSPPVSNLFRATVLAQCERISVIWRIQKMQNSVEVSDVVTERIHVSLLQFLGLWLTICFIFPLFSRPQFLSLYEERRLNWLHESKGGQAG